MVMGVADNISSIHLYQNSHRLLILTNQENIMNIAFWVHGFQKHIKFRDVQFFSGNAQTWISEKNRHVQLHSFKKKSIDSKLTSFIHFYNYWCSFKRNELTTIPVSFNWWAFVQVNGELVRGENLCADDVFKCRLYNGDLQN